MRRNQSETLEEALKNPAYIAIGGGVCLLIVVLFCVIVWNVTHQKDDKLVMNNTTNNTVEIPSMGESVEEDVVVTPAPEAVEDAEAEALKQLIAEKSNDQGLVFTEMDDWITDCGTCIDNACRLWN